MIQNFDKNSRTAARLRAALFSSATTLLLLGAASVQAQEAGNVSAATSQNDADTRDIIITGSRVGASAFNSPTPLTVVSGESLDKFQATNVADVLARLPAMKATFNPASTGFRTQFPGANFVDLYGLGSNRTLVLVNGTRVVPSAPASATGSAISVDLNLIPSLMVDRIDVVTGGASAQWGSDAIAGVVNVILRDKYNGIQVKAQSGISQRGDNANFRVGAMAGTSFADDRGQIVAGVDWADNDGLGDVYSRGWSSRLINTVANPNYATNGLPANVIAPGVVARSTAGGVIVGPSNFSLVNHQIVGNGQLAPFTVGQFPGTFTMVGGDPNAPSFIKNNNLMNAFSRINSYARASFELSPALTLIAEGSYGVVKSSNIVNPPRSLNQVINVQNAFLTDEIRNAMIAENITTFNLNRQNYDLTGPGGGIANGVAHGLMKTTRIVFGAKGDLGNNWNWDANYTWGRGDYRNRTKNNLRNQYFAFAVDSIRLPSGEAVCRATQPGPAFNPAAAGCVPVDLFHGVGSPSTAAANYYLFTVDQYSDYRHENAAINLRGQPFSTWAGPVGIAAGLEYRRESHAVTVDPVSDAGGYLLNNARNLDGAFNVKEGYFEALIPFAKDLPFARSLDLDAAVRFADYSSVGSHTTWKFGVNYEPIAGLRFRATRSRDLRAPAIFELVGRGAINQNTVTLRGATRNIPVNSAVGNPDLNPETGDTLTLGTVFQPSFLPGLRISVDYYKVELRDTIVGVQPPTIAARCDAGEIVFCNQFTFDTTGAPIRLIAPVMNIGFVKMDGIDTVVSYKTGLGSIPGSLSLDFDMTYVRRANVNLGLGSPTIDRAGENGGNNQFSQPRTRFTLSSTYDVGPVDLTARVDFISSGTIDNSYNTSPATTITNNKVPAVAYLSFYGNVDVSENFQLFASIQNALDRDPPVVPLPNLFQQTNAVYYDVIGRRFQVGVSMKF